MTGKKETSTTADSNSTPRYALEELKAQAKELFDVKEEVLAGAFYGETDDLFTVAEAQTKIEQFMKAKVD